MLTIQPPNVDFPRSPKFEELGTLYDSTVPLDVACYLDLQLVRWMGRQLFAACVTSRGHVHGWSVCLSDAVDGKVSSWNSTLLWNLKIDHQTLSPPAISCLCTSLSDLLVVGVDDGSVRVARLTSLEQPPEWSVCAVHHFASVLRLNAPNEAVSVKATNRRLFSLGADQRIIHWHASTDGATLTPIQRLILSGLGDPHDLSVSVDLPSNDEAAELEKELGPVNRARFGLITGTGSIVVRL